LLVVTLALAVAIPWIVRQQWALTGRQTALAGGVSVLVCVIVTGYALRPETGYPLLDRLTLPGFSPELDRPVGGGPGASAINQPANIRLRSKITGTLPHEP
jgi:hypothetical protein